MYAHGVLHLRSPTFWQVAADSDNYCALRHGGVWHLLSIPGVAAYDGPDIVTRHNLPGRGPFDPSESGCKASPKICVIVAATAGPGRS